MCILLDKRGYTVPAEAFTTTVQNCISLLDNTIAYKREMLYSKEG